MKKFDFLNSLGRIVIGCYFIINGICLIQSIENPVFPEWIFWFTYFTAILGLIGGTLLIIGIKPRATAATLAVLLLIFTLMDFTFFASSDWQQQHILQQYIPTKNVGFQKALVSNWASQQIHVFLGKIAILGACLFIVGSRTIPYCVMARTENNLRNKYGE